MSRKMANSSDPMASARKPVSIETFSSSQDDCFSWSLWKAALSSGKAASLAIMLAPG